MGDLVPDRMREQLGMIDALRSAGVYAYGLPVTSSCESRITAGGRERINFISNNYLGFSTHPRVKEAVKRAVDRYGVGIGGSPLACGTTEVHARLKDRIATVYRREAVALFASGYQALLGAIQASIGKGDAALLDSLVHRSIVDGVILSRAESRTWNHNDLGDLESLLRSTRDRYRRRLIVVDSVYSMHGDLADLPGLRRLADAHDALILIDEAHALGVIGPSGGGLPDHFGMPEGADLIAGTFSKFAGSVGGYVAGLRDFIDGLQHAASPFVFSASLPPAVCAGVLEAFELLEEMPETRARLWENVRFLLDGFKAEGFDTGGSVTPVIPVLIRDPMKTMAINRFILERGIYASPVVYPGVAPSESRIRLGVMATHGREDLERCIDAFVKARKEVM